MKGSENTTRKLQLNLLIREIEMLKTMPVKVWLL